MDKILYLVRGVAGSGKSTLAGTLVPSDCVMSADSFFEKPDGSYQFNPDHLGRAHSQCLQKTENLMSFGTKKIAVANTFVRNWEMKTYFTLAEKYGYTVFSMIVENRHGGENVHGVPDEKVQQMRDRMQVKL